MTKKNRQQKTIEKQFTELDRVVLKTCKNSYKITLAQLFNLLSNKSLNDNTICQENARIGEHIIKDARSHLIAKFPGLYADKIEGWPKSEHRFLIDENLPKTLSIYLWHEFGRATHTEYEKLQKEKDPEVWQWAVKNNIKAIITQDVAMGSPKKDLGAIAILHAHKISSKKAKKLPFIIQVDPQNSTNTLYILKKHKDAIHHHIKNRTTPYIHLTMEKCITGPSYEDFDKYNWTIIKTMVNSISHSLKLERQCRSASSPSSDQAPIARRHHGYSK